MAAGSPRRNGLTQQQTVGIASAIPLHTNSAETHGVYCR
jgi:hypothetical protein